MNTIYDVARMAKTSPASVSRVINGRGGVGADVAERIKSAIGNLDFQPQSKALDRNRFLVLIPERSPFHSGYVSRIMSGISDAAFSLGFGLQLRPFSFHGNSANDMRQLYMQEAVAGCLLISHCQGYSIPRRLEVAGVPHVVVANTNRDDDVNQIFLDNVEAGRVAAEFLLSLGHRRLAMVSFNHLDQGHLDRYKGMVVAMKKAGLTDPVCFQSNETTYDAGRSAARRLLSPHERPTAVIITNEDLAAGFSVEARAMGISVPKEVSVLAFEETETLSLMEPSITAMQSPVYAMGVEAVRMLHAITTAKTKQKLRQTKSLGIQLITRGSTASVG